MAVAASLFFLALPSLTATPQTVAQLETALTDAGVPVQDLSRSTPEDGRWVCFSIPKRRKTIGKLLLAKNMVQMEYIV